MTTAAPCMPLATIQPVFTDAERVALAGFLAGYRGLTREAYALDLRQFTSWCRGRSVGLFAVRRADIETFARDLEVMGRARAMVTRRLSTIAHPLEHQSRSVRSLVTAVARDPVDLRRAVLDEVPAEAAPGAVGDCASAGGWHIYAGPRLGQPP